MDKRALKETYTVHKDGELQMNIYPQGYKNVLYHWHDEFEFIYVNRGICKCIISGQRLDVTEGQAALVQSGELHTLSVDPKVTDAIAIVLHPSIIAGNDSRKYFSSSIKFKRLYTGSTAAERRIIDDLADINKCFNEKQFGYELRIKALTADIFSLIFENNMYSINEKTESDTLFNFERIIEFVHENYAFGISLDSLAKYSGYSKTYVISLFKKHTGMTPVEYINRFRIHKAQEMLEHTEKNILNVALDCGFENIGYFIRVFKRFMGSTPYKYKKRAGA